MFLKEAGSVVDIYTSVEDFLSKKRSGSSKASIFTNGILFPFEYKLSEESDCIVFFFPGAFDRSNPMPKFQRSSYFPSLKFNCISFFDPTLFLTDDDKFTRAWFVGDCNDWYIDHLSHIVNVITSSREIDNSNMLFFGSSAGGVPSINLASRFVGSHAYCCNIQTNILSHYPNYVDRLIKTCFGGKADLEEVRGKYYERFDITGIDSRFFLHLVQNQSDTFHYKKHFLPYLDSLKSSNFVSYESFVYEDDSRGHNPLPRSKEIEVINNIFSSGTFAPCFDGKVETKLF